MGRWFGVAGLVAAALLIIPRAGKPPRPVRPYSAWSGVTNPLVNLLISRGIAALAAFAAGLSSGRQRQAVATVPHVDLGRFAGQWFEVARLPISSERQLRTRRHRPLRSHRRGFARREPVPPGQRPRQGGSRPGPGGGCPDECEAADLLCPLPARHVAVRVGRLLDPRSCR